MAKSIQSRTAVFSSVSQLIAHNTVLPEAILVPIARNCLRLYSLLTDYPQSTADLFVAYQARYSEPLDAHRISSHLIGTQRAGAPIIRKVERSGFPAKHMSYWHSGKISQPLIGNSRYSEPVAVLAELLQDGLDLFPTKSALAYSAQSALEIYSLLSQEAAHSSVIVQQNQQKYHKEISCSLVQNNLHELAKHGAPIVKTHVPSEKLRGRDLLHWSINTKYLWAKKNPLSGRGANP